MSRMVINTVLAASAIGVLVGTGLLSNSRRMNSSAEEQRGDKVKILNAGVTLAGTLAWPVVWDCTVGYSELVRKPWMVSGFLWPMVMNMMQLFTSTTRPCTTSHDVRIPFIAAPYGDAAMLISTIFAMGTLLSMSQKGEHPEVLKTYLMYSLLLCIAFIVPTAHFNPGYATSAAVRSGQRVLLNYSIGYVISAVVTFATKNAPGVLA